MGNACMCALMCMYAFVSLWMRVYICVSVPSPKNLKFVKYTI